MDGVTTFSSLGAVTEVSLAPKPGRKTLR